MDTAFVGCAHIHTPGFIKRLNARDDVRVKMVWDPDPTRARRRAGELGAEVASSPAEIWHDSHITSVVVCSETRDHEDLVTQAARAGKHLFVEKPLGLGAGDAAKMAEEIERAGVLFQTGYFLRGDPLHQFLKEHIGRRSFGTITRIRHTNCHQGALEDWFTPEWLWMTDPEAAGCGSFGDLGTHSLDILMWLMGDVERVAAVLARPVRKYGERCDETGEALLQFRNGVLGSMAAGWVDVAHPISLMISGTEGHAYIAQGELYFKSKRVAGADGARPWSDVPAAWPHAFDLFFDAVQGKNTAPLVSVREAAARNLVMEALYQAAGGGCWVEVGAAHE